MGKMRVIFAFVLSFFVLGLVLMRGFYVLIRGFDEAVNSLTRPPHYKSSLS